MISVVYQTFPEILKQNYNGIYSAQAATQPVRVVRSSYFGLRIFVKV